MSEETKQCPNCGEKINAEAKKCRFCGTWLNGESNKSEKKEISNSTSNNKQPLPKEYKIFNWGAFLTTWIWGLCNKSYLTFLIFAGSIIAIIPFIGWFVPLGLQIWFGIKGNEWAWQNNEWESLEQFNENQRKWAKWSAIVVGILTVISIIFMLIYCLLIVGAVGLGALLGE